MADTMSCISMVAKALPTQRRGPPPDGKWAEAGKSVDARRMAACRATFCFELLPGIGLSRQDIPDPGQRARDGRMAGDQDGLQLVVQFGFGEWLAARGDR